MIYMFLANGFEEVEALYPLDLLRRAGLGVTTVGIGGDHIIGAHGVRVQADIPDILYRDSKPDMIILPGGMPGTTYLDESPTVDVALRAAVSSGAYLAAICAAPMVLGKRGYLAGKHVTCYPGFEKYLTDAHVVPTDRFTGVMVDGRVITARGMGVAMEFGLTLVGMMCGQEKSAELRAAILAN